ncbi:DUF4340 domain-containing protein, partial [Kaarinaea lacus]
EPGKETPPPVSRLTTLNKTDINTVRIEQAQQDSIVLQKENGIWLMQQPISIAANTILIQKLLEILDTTSHSSYPATEINADNLKLSNPSLKITFNNTSLVFGSTDALNGYRYILNGDRVHLITDQYSHLVRGKPTALISHSLLPENLSITGLRLPKMTLQKNQGGWSVEPDDQQKSADQIQTLIDEWRFARALQVSILDKPGISTDNTHAPQITVHSANNDMYQFNLVENDDEILLIRPDVGLRYHFTREAGNKLLGLLNPETSSEASH